MAISDQLREAMQGYESINRVAKDSGISQPILHRFYHGERDLRLETADKLAAFFGMRLTKPTAKQTVRRNPRK